MCCSATKPMVIRRRIPNRMRAFAYTVKQQIAEPCWKCTALCDGQTQDMKQCCADSSPKWTVQFFRHRAMWKLPEVGRGRWALWGDGVCTFRLLSVWLNKGGRPMVPHTPPFNESALYTSRFGDNVHSATLCLGNGQRAVLQRCTDVRV